MDLTTGKKMFAIRIPELCEDIETIYVHSINENEITIICPTNVYYYKIKLK